MMHRGYLNKKILITTVAVILASARARPAEQFLFDAYVELDSRSITAVERAQDWLAATQLADGSWKTSYGRNNAGVIGFATMALMAGGSVPGEGKYAEEIGKALQFLLNLQRESGLIAGAENSKAPMYQHAIATIALAESFGMTRNPRIRESLIKAVNLIVETQHNEGGWRYQPKVEKGDISATVMQVMALRASVESGIYVPDDTIARAVRFIKNCYNPRDKGFGYTSGRGEAAFARTAAGLVSLQTVGLHGDPIIPDVVDYISDHAFKEKQGHYWYGHYYSSVGLYHYGGERWKNYYPKIKSKILGDWKKSGHYNNVLNTSWAIMILGVPYRYLPVYQR